MPCYFRLMARRILIVEDHEDVRAILRALLTHHEYQVFEEESAEAMFEVLPEVDPDLIVLDVRLPGMDGCQALTQLRAGGFDKPVFLYSEYFDLHARDIRNCRPDAFFPKSKGPLLLFEAIREKVPHSGLRGDLAH